MATTFENTRLDIDVLRQFLVPKHFTARLFEFSRREGILSLIRTMGRFTSQEFCNVIGKKLGYQIGNASRKRMLTILLDFLEECGHAFQEKPDSYKYTLHTKPIPKLSSKEMEIMEKTFGGQALFFERCIDYTGDFLRGRDYLYGFDKGMEDIWDKFLGNYEFSIARDMLLKAMAINEGSNCKIMDLCYGTGYGLEAICRNSPDTDITAIDFTDVMKPLAVSKVGSSAAKIRWIDANAWRGFGAKLPFEDMTFERVLFSCGDPYIPEPLRRDVYRDIFRVLKPAGIVGVVAWGYPDKEKKHIQNEWVRKGIYIHDFAESVCKGWNGFRNIDSTIKMARDIGFVETNTIFDNFYMLDSAIWAFKKP
ncbi:MAG: class I SAM-dependent methyltransferase [Deltaproteobacteria bacterium]|nr:class I SAM-dependent methyltransferase [Deltaproteobacteria bacterium]